MRIAVRSRDGSCMEPEGAEFVEMRSDAGEVAGLFYMDAQGRAHACTDPASPQAVAYARLFNIGFAKDVKQLED